MDKNIIIDELKNKNEIQPEEFDGTYRSVCQAIECYSKLRKTSIIDFHDLELLYSLSLGIWKNDRSDLKTRIQKCHMLHNDKRELELELDKIWSNGSRMLFGHLVEKQEMEFLTAPFSFRESLVAEKDEAIQFFFKCA